MGSCFAHFVGRDELGRRRSRVRCANHGDTDARYAILCDIRRLGRAEAVIKCKCGVLYMRVTLAVCRTVIEVGEGRSVPTRLVGR